MPLGIFCPSESIPIPENLLMLLPACINTYMNWPSDLLKRRLPLCICFQIYKEWLVSKIYIIVILPIRLTHQRIFIAQQEFKQQCPPPPSPLMTSPPGPGTVPSHVPMTTSNDTDGRYVISASQMISPAVTRDNPVLKIAIAFNNSCPGYWFIA